MTGVQTCALPISPNASTSNRAGASDRCADSAWATGSARDRIALAAAIGAASDGAQEGVQRERDRAVRGGAGVHVSAADLDVDVLVEGPRKPISGRWDHTPASTVVGDEGHGRVVGRIGETKEREILE